MSRTDHNRYGMRYRRERHNNATRIRPHELEASSLDERARLDEKAWRASVWCYWEDYIDTHEPAWGGYEPDSEPLTYRPVLRAENNSKA